MSAAKARVQRSTTKIEAPLDSFSTSAMLTLMDLCEQGGAGMQGCRDAAAAALCIAHIYV